MNYKDFTCNLPLLFEFPSYNFLLLTNSLTVDLISLCVRKPVKDMRFGTWNVRSLYRVGAIKSVVGELEKYKLDLVGVQEVRWEGEGYQTADNYTFFYEKGMLITN
jgi:hypothetical protein